jgi:hypothetical protein
MFNNIPTEFRYHLQFIQNHSFSFILASFEVSDTAACFALFIQLSLYLFPTIYFFLNNVHVYKVTKFSLLYLGFLTFVQVPLLDLSPLTFLYVLIFVALLKNIFTLTLYYSTHRIFCRKCIF